MVADFTADIPYSRIRGKKEIGIMLTRSEHQEILFLYSEYSKDYRKQLKNFYHAYCISNGIYSQSSSSSTRKYTPKELEELREIARMSSMIPKKEIIKLRLTA